MRRASREEAIQQIHRLGERIADELQISLSQLRYAKFVYHDGRQWTVAYRWERWRNGQWQELADGEWLDVPST